MENDFVVLPRMDWARFDGLFNRRYLWVARCGPWVEFKVMIERDGLFTRFLDECYSDLNLELAPPENLNIRPLEYQRIKLTLFLIPRTEVYLCLGHSW